MLKDPVLNAPFDPSLMWFIGVFDVYDREEELGEELEKYNPNKKSDREELIKKYALNLSYLSYRHRYALVENLKSTLSEENYDFQLLFEINEEDAASWPRSEWYELNNPKAFFEEIYHFAKIMWKDDLQKASLEAPSKKLKSQ